MKKMNTKRKTFQKWGVGPLSKTHLQKNPTLLLGVVTVIMLVLQVLRVSQTEDMLIKRAQTQLIAKSTKLRLLLFLSKTRMLSLKNTNHYFNSFKTVHYFRLFFLTNNATTLKIPITAILLKLTIIAPVFLCSAYFNLFQEKS